MGIHCQIKTLFSRQHPGDDPRTKIHADKQVLWLKSQHLGQVCSLLAEHGTFRTIYDSEKQQLGTSFHELSLNYKA